jgi:hypothetical protein
VIPDTTKPPEGEFPSVIPFTVSPDERHVIFHTQHRSIKMYDLDTKEMRTLPVDTAMNDYPVFFSADGGTMMIFSHESRYFMVNVGDFKVSGPYLLSTNITPMQPEKYCAARAEFLLGTDELLHTLPVHSESKRLISRFPGANDALYRYTADGKRLLAGLPGSVRIMSTQGGGLLYEFDAGSTAPRNLRLSEDENELLIADADSVHYFKRQHPEYWWGIATLPECWVVFFALFALLYQLFRIYPVTYRRKRA